MNRDHLTAAVSFAREGAALAVRAQELLVNILDGHEQDDAAREARRALESAQTTLASARSELDRARRER